MLQLPKNLWTIRLEYFKEIRGSNLCVKCCSKVNSLFYSACWGLLWGKSIFLQDANEGAYMQLNLVPIFCLCTLGRPFENWLFIRNPSVLRLIYLLYYREISFELLISIEKPPPYCDDSICNRRGECVHRLADPPRNLTTFDRERKLERCYCTQPFSGPTCTEVHRLHCW